MTITQDNWLDFSNLLVNEVFGDVLLFLMAGMFLIAWIGVRERLPVMATSVFILLFVAMVVSIYFNAFVWALLLLAFGVFIYVRLADTFTR